MGAKKETSPLAAKVGGILTGLVLISLAVAIFLYPDLIPDDTEVHGRRVWLKWLLVHGWGNIGAIVSGVLGLFILLGSILMKGEDLAG